ncbi:MAG: hypothetical protein ACRD0L_12050, partial [Acidimicrobiales bacterium]
MGRSSRRKADRRAHPARGSRPPPPPVEAVDEAAMVEVARATKGPDLSLGAAFVFGYAQMAQAINANRAPDWYDRMDALDLVFLGEVTPEEPAEEASFANARDAWLAILRASPASGALDDLIDAMVETSKSTGLPIDDPDLLMRLGAALAEVPSCLVALDPGLHPRACLAGHRSLVGPAPVELGAVPDDGLSRVAAFKAALVPGLPNDGTIGDALREGMTVAGELEMLSEPVLMVGALHAALSDDDRLAVSDLMSRALAWAEGLDPASPLVPVLDTIFSGAERGEDLDTVLARVLARPELEAVAPPSDRAFHSKVGVAASRAALGRPGTTTLLTADGELVRLSGTAAAIIHAQQRAFDERFGSEHAVDAPLFFDAHADEPTSVDPDAMVEAVRQMLGGVGISDQGRWVYEATGLMPPPAGHLDDAERQGEIEEARAEWMADSGCDKDEADAMWAKDCARMGEV